MAPAFTRRTLLSVFAATALAPVALAGPVESGPELIMFRREGCVWCRAWDRGIGQVYARTEFGAALPLRMVDLDQDPMPSVILAHRVVYTPTFVLVKDGREVGRIEGYPGEDFFWGMLEKMLRESAAAERGRGK